MHLICLVILVALKNHYVPKFIDSVGLLGAVHGVLLCRLPVLPVGDPRPAARRGLHHAQYRQHGWALRQGKHRWLEILALPPPPRPWIGLITPPPVSTAEQVHRHRIRHRVCRLRPQSQGDRGHWPQPLWWYQGPPLHAGRRT
jgi:hypothetical protein